MRRTGEIGLPHLGIVRDTVNARLMNRSDTTVYTLDVDATEIVASKQTAEVTYNGNKGYMPMLGFLAENQLCTILARDKVRFAIAALLDSAVCQAIARIPEAGIISVAGRET